jgi:hypothetical protein
MPTFEIPDGPTAIEAKRAGDPKNPQPALTSAVYSVTNKSSESVDGRLGIVPTGPSKAEWFAIDGDRERNFGSGETQTATVKVTFPPDAAAGDYPFRLRVVAINDPDNDHAEGPVTTAKLAGAGQQTKGSWLWLWILLGVLAVIVIAVVLYFVLRGDPVETAQKRAGEWATAAAARNIDALTEMSNAPFFLNDGAVLLTPSDIQNKYRTALTPGAGQLPPGTDARDPGEKDVVFGAIAALSLGDYRKAVPPNPEMDRAVKAMGLDDDDIVVIGDTQGVKTFLFFRRKGVKLAGVVD